MRYTIFQAVVLICLGCSTATFAQKSKLADDFQTRPLTLSTNQLQTEQPAPSDLQSFYAVVDTALHVEDLQSRIFGVARLADMLWKYDEAGARELFKKSLRLTNAEAQSGSGEKLQRWRQEVVVLIAKHDSVWARQLNTSTDNSSPSSAETNVAIAASLLSEQPETAIDFARQSLRETVDPSLIWFLKQLRKTDEHSADQLYLQALNTFARQPVVNISDLAMLGTYVFASRNSEVDAESAIVITRVGNIGVVDISADRERGPAPLVRAFLATSVEVLSRPIGDSYQRQTAYALAYQLLAKARIYAPDLLPVFSTALTSLSSGIPPSMTHDAAFANLGKQPSAGIDKLANAEKLGDANKRDVAYLDAAFHAWKRGDFVAARLAIDRISQAEPARALRTLTDFAEGSRLLEQPGGVSKAQALAARLPAGIEQSILFLAIAEQATKAGETNEAIAAAEQALQAARKVNEVRRPFLIAITAGKLGRLNPDLAYSSLNEAIKGFNQYDDSEIRSVSWSQSVALGPLAERFPLQTRGVDFRFGSAFRDATRARQEQAPIAANDLKSATLKIQAVIEIGRSILEALPEPQQSKEPVVRVGEDGIRKSAVKTVMPSYPADAVKQRKQGTAVVELQYNGKGDVVEASILEAPADSIGDAVISAVKQWKFKTSTVKGQPISVRGKLTFYFIIDESGNARVENPKQFQ